MKRKTWVAIIFSVLAPGLGHVYSGHLVRGLVFLGLLTMISFGKNIILLLAAQRSDNPYLALFVIIILLLTVYILAIVDAILLIRKEKDDFQLKKYNKWYIYIPVLIFTFLVIKPIGLHALLVQGYLMPSEGMMPTINTGDRILVDNFTYDKKKAWRGDIIVFRNPENPKIKLVKRIIGLPGETIEIRNKRVFIDGDTLREPYVVYYNLLNNKFEFYQFRDSLPPTTIPEGYYFVMGDNRDCSADSRLWGLLNRNLIEGEVKVIYSSGSEITWIKIEKLFCFRWNLTNGHSRIRWEEGAMSWTISGGSSVPCRRLRFYGNTSRIS